MGLLNLHRQAKSLEEQAEILQFLESSALSLETIIRDLGKIIEIRNDKFAFLETVDLQIEVDLIVQSLNSFIHRDEVTIRTDFQASEILSIKAYINSILYNLISNAIQYRVPGRKPVIDISSKLEDNFIVLQVSDNGLGINLEKYKGDLFKLYKRFHTHIQGKGLGLFIVKQQVEKLGGRIDVESVPEEGASFRIYHPRSLVL
jgi:signal transduction histidine kinase